MKSNKKHLIIGAGQIGSSLYKVLSPHYDVFVIDKKDALEGNFDVMHVCFPPVKNFVSIVKNYIKQYNPKLVIIHSTVPVGVTKKISTELAVHSPIRGVHPELHKGIKTFVKYFGGSKSKEAAKIFSDIGIETMILKSPETTELLKILDTTYYGWNIIFAKEVKNICDKFGVDFEEVHVIPNQHYNEGYKKMGKGHFTRPVLKHMPGKIGGHCVVPNCDLLDSWVTKTIKQRNRKY
jgi:UDP-N-acetyl-D-mannosaminuronate dehydrogenase